MLLTCHVTMSSLAGCRLMLQCESSVCLLKTNRCFVMLAVCARASWPYRGFSQRCMSGRGGGRGGGRGWYYKQKYGGGGSRNRDDPLPDAGRGSGSTWGPGGRSNFAQSQAQQQQDQWDGNADSDDMQQYQQGSTPGRMLGDAQQMYKDLHRLDGKGYKAYRDIEGSWQFEGFRLLVDHVQGDPYAAPSRLRVQIPAAVAGFPSQYYSSKLRRIALGDHLARTFASEANAASATAQGQARGWHGAKGGDVTVDKPGQHVLERTAVLVSAAGDVEGRFTVGLPAQGRSIMGPWAAQILTQHLPRAVQAGLLHAALDSAAIWHHIQTIEDTEALRAALPSLRLVGFVGDGSILPRQSGASDLPMSPSPTLVPFKSPESLSVTIQLPHRGQVTGMGIGVGITLIAGGGFHGKSTLLQALEAGVYNKVPGDGRELVVMVPDAVKVSAEDGRRVEAVDISPYINNLPGGTSTTAFCSDDASGSTSQAASIQEALEVCASVLRMDEDTCATNFMMRDSRMAQLVSPDKEPITPFSDKIASLKAAGVSTVLVMGGSGDYFSLADTVIVMDNYIPSDRTQQAHDIAVQHAATLEAARQRAAPTAGGASDMPASGPADAGVWFTPRMPVEICNGGGGGGGDWRGVKTHVRGLHNVQYGDQDIQLSAAEQLVDKSQTRAVAEALKWLQAKLSQHQQQQQQQQQLERTLMEWLQELEALLDNQGLDALAPNLALGNLARPRRFEIAAAVNRIRTLSIRQQGRRRRQRRLVRPAGG